MITMKKQITLLALLLFICQFSWSQKFIKASTPCNDELLKKTPGRWINAGDNLNTKISKQQQQEIFNRLDKIHQFVFEIYPSPVAVDAAWSRSIRDKNFATQLKISHLDGNRIYTETINGIPSVSYEYINKFFGYQCGRTPNEIIRGWPFEPGEDGTSVSVHVNLFEDYFTRDITDNPMKEVMRIDGRPIKLMPVFAGKWKGHNVYTSEQGSNLKMILLHRDGMVPYIPVTRKQYLERCLELIPTFFILDPESLKSMELLVGKKEREEQEKRSLKAKEDVIKRYRDELQATTAAGLLDSPAYIQVPILNMSITMPIFISEASGGTMLVTENPAYLQKNLPGYIPQFMVFTWHSYHLAMEPYKAIDENFPIEKLQAMIDK
jgi:hypothetical protein